MSESFSDGSRWSPGEGLIEGKFLSPRTIAREAVWLMREHLRPLLNDYRLTLTEGEAVQQGDSVPVHTVAEPGFDVGLATMLNIADVAFATSSQDLALPIGEFSDQFLWPAAHALGEHIQHEMSPSIADFRFISGPPPVPKSAFAAMEQLDGIYLRALYEYDMSRCAFVTSFCVLYGVAVPTPAMATAA